MPPRMPPPRMAPRHLVQLLLPLLLLLAACASIVAAAPPHVLILLADDLGHTDLGYTGATVATPVIDALAKAGVMLGSFYTWNWCAPSRGAIMTGVYAPRNGYALDASGGDSGSPSAVPLRWSFLPQLLKQRGYRTVGAGKWHMGYYDRQHLPEARGFDSWFGYLGGAEDYYHHNYTSRACGFSVVDLWQADGGAGSGAFASDASYFPQFSPYMFTEHLVRKITAHGATAAAPAEAPVSAPPAPPPLFVYAALQSVHSPKQVTENYWRGAASFSRELEELCPWSETDDGHSDFDCTSQPRFQGYADGKGDNCYCQRQITLAMVRALDDSVANITAAFRTAGLWEQTVTIFMGDNGGPVNNGHSNVPFRGGKL
jgi:arylsulfatase A-like enzyme